MTDSLRAIIYAVIFLVIGGALEWLFGQYTKNRLMQIEFFVPQTLRERVRTTFSRTAFHVGGLVCFAFGSIGAFLTFDWPEIIREIVLDFLLAVLLVRLVFIASRAIIAPRLKHLRLVPLRTRQARLVHYWVVGLATAFLISRFVVGATGQTFAMLGEGEPPGAALSVNLAVNVMLALLALAAVWHCKARFEADRGPVAPLRGRLGNPWPVYLSVLVVLALLLWVINAGPLMATVLIVGLLFPMLKLAGAWIDNLFDQAQGTDMLHGAALVEATDKTAEAEASSESAVAEPEDESGPEAAEMPEDETSGDDVTINHSYDIYRSVTRRVVRFILVALTILALVHAWGINLFELSASRSFGGIVFNIMVDTLFAVLLADLVWHWAKTAIDRRLADYTPPPDGKAPGPEARMATLLPMLRVILMVTLLAIVILSVLTSFGVNIGPLLAGAGVVGVAIGFGAQALVRDVVSGIFFLIDDAFRIGEYIEVDNLRGTVESMSIRSLRVRHHRGMVHTIPFGELKSLTNYSRDWVIMKLEFRVPFDTDLKLVKKIVKKIGAELLENETYGDSIIQTLKSQGVRRMEEFNMVVGVKFMAKPGEQWLIRRDAYQKVRDAFEANGIGFAERNVKVEVLGDHPVNEETKKAIVGAAQDAIEQQLPPMPVKDEP